MTHGRHLFEAEVMRRQRPLWPQLANNQAPEVFRYVDDVVIVTPAPRDHDHDTEADSGHSDVSHTSFDHQVASAADFLVHHGYVFDWESQLDEAQQRLFHSIATYRLRALREER